MSAASQESNLFFDLIQAELNPAPSAMDIAKAWTEFKPGPGAFEAAVKAAQAKKAEIDEHERRIKGMKNGGVMIPVNHIQGAYSRMEKHELASGINLSDERSHYLYVSLRARAFNLDFVVKDAKAFPMHLLYPRCIEVPNVTKIGHFITPMEIRSKEPKDREPREFYLNSYEDAGRARMVLIYKAPGWA